MSSCFFIHGFGSRERERLTITGQRSKLSSTNDKALLWTYPPKILVELVVSILIDAPVKLSSRSAGEASVSIRRWSWRHLAHFCAKVPSRAPHLQIRTSKDEALTTTTRRVQSHAELNLCLVSAYNIRAIHNETCRQDRLCRQEDSAFCTLILSGS